MNYLYWYLFCGNIPHTYPLPQLPKNVQFWKNPYCVFDLQQENNSQVNFELWHKNDKFLKVQVPIVLYDNK